MSENVRRHNQQNGMTIGQKEEEVEDERVRGGKGRGRTLRKEFKQFHLYRMLAYCPHD